MIGKLSGVIDSIDTGHFILDVGGVGYFVHASRRTLSRIGHVGDVASLRIETQVREDAITLFGFIDASEQAWFKLLTSVQGVGAKVGLAILSVCPPEKLAVAIAAQDKAVIRQADGVGPKLAVRILTELKDKAGKIELPVSTKPLASVNTPEAKVDSPINDDAVSALVNLGYGRAEAYTAVMNAVSDAQNDNDLQAIIRLALKDLGR